MKFIALLLNGLNPYGDMRITKLFVLIVPLLAIGYIINGAIAADTEKSPVSVVPKSPISATCAFTDGKTVVRITAIETISDVSLVFADGSGGPVVSELQKGWSIVQSFSGVHQSVTVVYSWRGAVEQTPIPCR